MITAGGNWIVSSIPYTNLSWAPSGEDLQKVGTRKWSSH